MKKKLILGFDSWVGGVSHYALIQNELTKLNLELQVLHIGSWGHNKYIEKKKIINGVTTVDVSFYNNMNLKSILKQTSPAAILFLSVDAFAHRAVIRYARTLGIPTINMYHGIISVQDYVSGVPDKYNTLGQFKLVCNRLYKNLTKIIPCYTIALLTTNAGTIEWRRFLSDLFTKVRGGYASIAASDSTTDLCLVYVEKDVEHAYRKYQSKKTVVVGNPDLIKFDIELKDISSNNPDHTKSVIYIDHGGSVAGLNFSGTDEFMFYLKRLNGDLISLGYRLKVKLHPAQYEAGVAKSIEDEEIYLISNVDFKTELSLSSCVITGPSTASQIACILGCVVLTPKFDNFRTQEYGKLIEDYPRHYDLFDVMEVPNLINAGRKVTDIKIIDWVRLNCGPIPASRMPERVAGSINELLLHAQIAAI